MFNRVPFYAVAFAAALCLGAISQGWAQQAKPNKPSPKSGTHEFTLQEFDQFRAAQKIYQDTCGRNASLADMKTAFESLSRSQHGTNNAIFDEVENRPELRTLRDDLNHYNEALVSLQKRGTDYEAELKAQNDYSKAYHKYLTAIDENMESVGKALGFVVSDRAPEKCNQQEMAENKQAKLNTERLKKMQEKTATGSKRTDAPPKNNCPNNGGLTGNIENVACQDKGK